MKPEGVTCARSPAGNKELILLACRGVTAPTGAVVAYHAELAFKFRPPG
jgi:hypothetical protein